MLDDEEYSEGTCYKPNTFGFEGEINDSLVNQSIAGKDVAFYSMIGKEEFDRRKFNATTSLPPIHHI